MPIAATRAGLAAASLVAAAGLGAAFFLTPAHFGQTGLTCSSAARMARVELLFGTQRKDAPPVSEEDWTSRGRGHAPLPRRTDGLHRPRPMAPTGRPLSKKRRACSSSGMKTQTMRSRASRLSAPLTRSASARRACCAPMASPAFPFDPNALAATPPYAKTKRGSRPSFGRNKAQLKLPAAVP
jgi:hypothetical protein